MSKASRRRRSAAEWSSILEDWRCGGEPLAQYAKRCGLSAGTMRWWRTQLARRATATDVRENPRSHAKRDAPSSCASSQASFARVVVTQSSLDVGRLEVVARSGHVVRVVGQVDAARLRALLGALDAC